MLYTFYKCELPIWGHYSFTSGRSSDDAYGLIDSFVASSNGSIFDDKNNKCL